MKIAFATVVFPKVQKFWNEFILSILNQTFKKFDLIVVNDGCQISELPIYNLNTYYVNPGKSIIDNRLKLFEYLIKENYDWVIFGDTDDYFSENRIEETLNYRSDYNIVVNEIIPFNEKIKGERLFSNRLQSKTEISKDFERDKNIFGFSNVACEVSLIKDILIPKDIIAVDWYIFASMFYKNGKACFTSDALTYYRQWEENIIGINKLERDIIIRAIKAKYFHYKAMQKYDLYFEKNIIWLEKLMKNIESNEINKYIDKVINSGINSPFWWENIKDL